MTDTTQDNRQDIFRGRFERERQARVAAEAQIEAMSRELTEARKRLATECALSKEALAEAKILRARECVGSEERAALVEAMAAIADKPEDEGMRALLGRLRDRFSACDACYLTLGGDVVRVAASARPELAGGATPLKPEALTRAQRLPALCRGGRKCANRTGMEGYADAIAAPVAAAGGPAGALLLARTEGRFSGEDLNLLERVAEALAARRNGRPPLFDAGSEAPNVTVQRAFARMTDMQHRVVEILDELLSAPISNADKAIDRALERLGRLTDMDRVYIFRLHRESDVLENTREWSAPGVVPTREALRGMTSGLAERWLTIFEKGGDVLIPDVAALPETSPEREALEARDVRSFFSVPMEKDGEFYGFVGFDAVRGYRSFLPGEMDLIRSVVKAIVSVKVRRDAENRLTAAHRATVAQRRRLQAVLRAMPDLVLEMSASGRFVSWYSGAIPVPESVARDYDGKLLEDVLPPEVAAIGRKAMAEVDSDGVSVGSVLAFDLGEGPRSFQLSASGIGDGGYLFVLRDVTGDREKTEELTMLSDLVRRTSNLVVVTDRNLNIDWVNAAFEKITGWKLDEIVGRNPLEFLPTEVTDPDVVARLGSALKAGKPVQAEFQNRSRDGRLYWINVDIQPRYNSMGEHIGFMAIEKDVTEVRVQAEALRRSAEEAAKARAVLEAAVNALEDGFVLFDSEDRLVICNERYREIYAECAPILVSGVTFESILRYSVGTGIYGIPAGREEEWVQERLSWHRASSQDVEQRRPDGRWLRIYEKQTPDGGRVGLRVDITELKQAEARALADRSAVLEASQEGICITDEDGLFVYLNRAQLEMFGYEREEELLGKHWSTLYSPETATWLSAVKAPELRKTGRWSGEILGVARDGGTVDQEISLTHGEDGRTLCISRDMRPRRREAAERDRLREELQLSQRREVISQMAAGLAHDFNNLLATISGSASLIEETSEKGALAKTGARRIMSATDQAAALVKRMLALGARQSEPVSLDLRRPVEEAAELLRPSLRMPMRLRVDMQDTPAMVMADPTDILQVVLNLAINARDAIAGRVGEISISLNPAKGEDLAGPFALGRIRDGRSYHCLTVADTGGGIEPDLVLRIFRPYFSTKGAQGTGLGLAVVSSVIRAIDGAVTVDSTPGEGTRFRILWPAEEAELPKPAPQAPEPARNLDGKAVLLVDDQEDVLEVLKAMFESAGAFVRSSVDPQRILDALNEEPEGWDLLVTDYDMPGMNGAELAESARNSVPNLPIILVTALAGVDGRSASRFNAMIAKPVDRDALISASAEAIESAEGGGT